MKKLDNLLKVVNAEMLMDMANEVNSWDNSLEYASFIDMEDFDEYMNHLPAIDLAYKIHYGDFNPCDEYFNFNAYGNLVSYDSWDVWDELMTYKEDIVKRFIELYEDGHVESYSQEVINILDDDIIDM